MSTHIVAQTLEETACVHSHPSSAPFQLCDLIHVTYSSVKWE